MEYRVKSQGITDQQIKQTDPAPQKTAVKSTSERMVYRVKASNMGTSKPISQPRDG